MSKLFPLFENLTNLFIYIGNKSFTFDSTDSIPQDLLSSSKYDISDCVSNCSNQGLCKLSSTGFKFVCECNSNFSGSKCDIDLRPCSFNPCLNYVNCESLLLLSSSSFDFKCFCKDGFYGKRCQHKINLCENETCSGNGICQVISNNQSKYGESIECKCFGIGQYEGKSCETKTVQAIIRQTTVKTTYIIAIVILVVTN